jgi:hypothetical protein
MPGDGCRSGKEQETASRPSLPEPEDDIRIPRPLSVDPNDIIGPVGFSEPRLVAIGDTLGYTIRFENDPTFATAPAQSVRITQQLDADLDYRSFRVGDFGFGEIFVDVPEDQGFYIDQLDLTEELGILLDVVAGIDTIDGEAFWQLRAIDPTTGDLPANPLLGFLPPNEDGIQGQGFVTYSVRPRQDSVQTGDLIDALATIVFDINEPIDTPPIFNTIDAGAPQSSVAPLPDNTEEQEFVVVWSGRDEAGGSGIRDYTIYVSTHGGQYEVWLEETTLTEAVFVGQPGGTYEFYSIARDNVGLRETAPSGADARTSVAGGNWQNPVDRFDVSGFRGLTPVDILILITYINSHPGDPSLPPPSASPPPFYDVSGDGYCTAEDILLLVNEINRLAGLQGEGESAATAAASNSSQPSVALPNGPETSASAMFEAPADHQLGDRYGLIPSSAATAWRPDNAREEPICHRQGWRLGNTDFLLADERLADLDTIMDDIASNIDRHWGLLKK